MHKCGVVVELLVHILCDLVPTLNVTNCRKQPLKKVKVELRHQIFCEKNLQHLNNIQSLIWKNPVYAVYVILELDILFPSNHNIHKNSCGLCF